MEKLKKNKKVNKIYLKNEKIRILITWIYRN